MDVVSNLSWPDQARRDDGSIWKSSTKISQERHGQTKAWHPEIRKRRHRKRSQAGDCDWAFRSSKKGRQSTKEKIQLTPIGRELETILIAGEGGSEMAVLRVRRNRRKRKIAMSKGHPREGRATSETEFKGPNVNKRHRKPDEIYGDTSIPDSARNQ